MQQSDRRHDSAASKEITYTLQEGVEPSSQIDFLEVSKEIPYVLQEGGGRIQPSDRHSESAEIERGHVLSAGGESATVSSSI